MKALEVADYVERIDKLETAYDGFQLLRKLCDETGFSRFSIFQLGDEQTNISDLSTVNNWDPELVHIYDQNGLAERSPVLNHMRSSARPMEYEVSKFPDERPGQEKQLVIDLFNDFKMRHGVSLPTRNVNGIKGGIGFSAPKRDFRDDDIYGLHLVANYIFDKITTGSEQVNTPNVSLSNRERDCLRWTAAGKTSSEIAVILGLSDHTVNHYLTSAGKKLDAVNRVQAVAKAIRMNLLNG